VPGQGIIARARPRADCPRQRQRQYSLAATPTMEHPMRRPIFFDPDLEASFMARGCAQTPLMSAPQMDDLVSAYAAMRPADGFDPRTNQANPFNASSYHCTFLDTNIGYKRQVQALIERVCLPAISRLVDDYKVLTANIYVKPPGAGLFQIHQNWPTCRNFDETSITVWIPLQDVGQPQDRARYRIDALRAVLSRVRGGAGGTAPEASADEGR
jgi:hypothetical protein